MDLTVIIQMGSEYMCTLFRSQWVHQRSCHLLFRHICDQYKAFNRHHAGYIMGELYCILKTQFSCIFQYWFAVADQFSYYNYHLLSLDFFSCRSCSLFTSSSFILRWTTASEIVLLKEWSCSVISFTCVAVKEPVVPACVQVNLTYYDQLLGSDFSR